MIETSKFNLYLKLEFYRPISTKNYKTILTASFIFRPYVWIEVKEGIIENKIKEWNFLNK